MSNRLIHLLTILVSATCFALVVPSNANAEVFKLATIAPENSEWMRSMRAGAKEIKQRTEGRVDIKLFGGGIQGNDSKVLRKMRIGQLHGGAFTAGSMMSFYPDLSIYGLPLLFNSQEEVDFVRARLDTELKQGLEDAGFVSFGFAGGGFAVILGNTPVRSLDDLNSKKVWVPEGDEISYAGMEALDLSPVTLPLTDVLTGLQTGLLDVVATPPVGALVLQWHTKVKYATNVPLVYTMAFIAIDKKRFDRLSEADQAVVDEVLSGIYEQFDVDNRAENENALAALQSVGIEFVDLNPGQLDSWRDAVSVANETLANEDVISRDMFDRVQALLVEYRSAPSAASAD
ncbi:MAG: TRAP transporter substrate-binding protein DctP [Pseudomonadota bacterium]